MLKKKLILVVLTIFILQLFYTRETFISVAPLRCIIANDFMGIELKKITHFASNENETIIDHEKIFYTNEMFFCGKWFTFHRKNPRGIMNAIKRYIASAKEYSLYQKDGKEKLYLCNLEIQKLLNKYQKNGKFSEFRDSFYIIRNKFEDFDDEMLLEK